MKIYVQKQIQSLYTPNEKKKLIKFNIIKQNETGIKHIHGQTIDNKGHVLKINLKKYKISDFKQNIKNNDSYKLKSNEIYKIYDESKIKNKTKPVSKKTTKKPVDKKKTKQSTKKKSTDVKSIMLKKSDKKIKTSKTTIKKTDKKIKTSKIIKKPIDIKTKSKPSKTIDKKTIIKKTKTSKK